jgi:hypothetical protein
MYNPAVLRTRSWRKRSEQWTLNSAVFRDMGWNAAAGTSDVPAFPDSRRGSMIHSGGAARMA